MRAPLMRAIAARDHARYFADADATHADYARYA